MSRAGIGLIRIFYRVAGLPIACAARFAASSSTAEPDPLRSVFAQRYWLTEDMSDWTSLVIGIVLCPIVPLLVSAWFTARNGATIRQRYGTRVAAQFVGQIRLYFSAGVLAPWYYIFEFHDEGAKRAKSFIHRYETKGCIFPLLKPRRSSPLHDKNLFARYCEERGLRCVKTVKYLHGGDPGRPLPDQDLFVKPTTAKGGRGAERWDRIAPSRYVGSANEQLSGDALLARLVARSRRTPLIVQPRLRPHPQLAKITAGALPTLRILTCLNEAGGPEVMAALLRTSIGESRTVDNLHAGGIGALVNLESGELSRSSNLGVDARLGWFSAHPDSGEQIEGRSVPFWTQAKALAKAAHWQFNDRVVVGWDIAILEDGPILIEGNGNPDLDIMQRFMRVGMRDHRFGRLLAFHLQQRGERGTPTRAILEKGESLSGCSAPTEHKK